MARFKVTVKFDRVNPETNESEKSERESIFESENAETAKAEYLERFKENEPSATNEEVIVETLATEENVEEEDAG